MTADEKKFLQYAAQYGDMVYFEQLGYSFLILGGLSNLREALVHMPAAETFGGQMGIDPLSRWLFQDRGTRPFFLYS